MKLAVTSPMSIEGVGRTLHEGDLGGRNARVALAVLALERRPVHREELADILWGEHLPSTWPGALRGVVSKVRSTLATCFGEDDVITSRGGAYRLHLPAGVEVDVDEAMAAGDAATEALRSGDANKAAEAARAAVAVAGRPFLAGEEGEWVERRRRELENLYREALGQLATAELRAGDWRGAVATALRGLAVEPLREQFWVTLMQAHAAGGNRAEALRAYERCRVTLAEELGIDPSPVTQSVYSELLLDRPPDSRPAFAAEPRRAGGGLPTPLAPLIGRDDDVRAVAGLLERHRLVSVTGVGGSGKSRLALAVAHEVASRSVPGGAWVVDLAPVREESLVREVIAAAVGVSEHPGWTLEEGVVERLRQGRCLLVLDNCEHLLDACAEVLERLLGGCPELVTLATTRELIGLPGEVAWPVRPLSLVAPDTVATEGDALKSAAVQLFVERARAVRPDFRLWGRADASTVAEICTRLDGLPLAIELAAARVSVLSVEQLASRLADRFALLTVGNRAEARHRTLRAAMDWSYDLLDEPEKALLRRLSMFASWFTLGAAEAVAPSCDLGRGLVPTLGSLVAKSLLSCDADGAEARYRLLETVRQYGAERLVEAEDEIPGRAAYAAWHIALAEEADAEITGGRQAVGLRRVDEEIDNLREAMTWLLRVGDGAGAMRLAGALGVYWHVRGHFSEGKRWLQQAIQLSGRAPAGTRAKAEWALGFLTMYSGSLPDALPAVAKSVELAREAGDVRQLGRALSLSGDIGILMHPLPAVPVIDEAVALARRTEDFWCLADSLGKLGWAHMYLGDPGAAVPFFEECRSVARQVDDLRSARRGTAGLGWAALLGGDLPTAQRLLEEALSLARALRDATWTAQTLNVLGEVARQQGDLDRARVLVDEGIAIGEQISSPFVLALGLGFRGRAEQSAGDLDAADEAFEAALATARAAHIKHFSPWWLQGRGEVALMRNQYEKARELFVAALAVAEEIPNARDVEIARGWLRRVADETASGHHRLDHAESR